MVDKNTYERLKEEYGHIASWAVWEKSSGAAKSNMGDVSMFDTDDILEVLNPNYVFIGLNGSGVHDDYMDMDRPWHNFHSSKPSGHDYKLRYALMDTPYWGAYITDAMKGLVEVDSGKVVTYLKKNPGEAIRSMEILKKEIEILGGHPTIVCLGGDSYNLVSKYLGNQFTVKKIIHYSYTIGPVAYREHIVKVLSNGNEEINIPTTPKVQKAIETPKVIEVPKKVATPIKPVVSATRTTVDGLPSLEENLKRTGLDVPNNWRGNIKNQFLSLFEPIVKDTDYSIRINEGDKIKVSLNLFYKDEESRCMGFEKLKDMNIKFFPVTKFYDEIKYKIELPALDPKKKQPHMQAPVAEFWEILYKITR